MINAKPNYRNNSYRKAPKEMTFEKCEKSFSFSDFSPNPIRPSPRVPPSETGESRKDPSTAPTENQ